MAVTTVEAISGQRGGTARRRWPLTVAGLVLLAAGAASGVVADELPAARAEPLGSNAPVNRGATDPLDVSALNSPVLVANPTDADNLVVVSRVDNPRFSCTLHVSTNGGSTWEPRDLPGFEEDKVVDCFSPDASFGPDGTLYLSFTSFARVEGHGTVPDGLWLVRSRDGGRTLSPPVRASGPLAFHARVVADPTTPKRVYLVWVQTTGAAGFGFTSVGNPIVISRSDDSGATWSSPGTVSAPERQRVIAPVPVVSRGGQLLVAYLDVGNDALDYSGAHEGRGGDPYAGHWQLLVARSADAGATWAESVVEPRLVPTRRFVQLFPPTPSLVSDRRTGRAYVALEDSRLGDSDVWVWASPGRRAWDGPRRVNDTPSRDGRSQYLPQLALSPTGRLDVVYYDRRSDPKDMLNEVSVQSSTNQGRSFTSRAVLTNRSFDSRVGFGTDRQMPELGNRLGLLSAGRGSLAVWADTRAGNDLVAKQDLVQAVAVFLPSSPWRAPLRAGGGAFAALGVVILVAAVRRHRSPPSPATSYDETGGSELAGPAPAID